VNFLIDFFFFYREEDMTIMVGTCLGDALKLGDIFNGSVVSDFVIGTRMWSYIR
jgi:hypothetical protein